MKTTMNKAVIGGLICVYMTVGSAMATPILFDWQDGTTNYPFAGWANEAQQAGDTTTGVIDTGGESGVALGSQTGIVVTADTEGILTPRTDVIYTEAFAGGTNLTEYGQYNVELAGMRTDFYAGANGDGTGAPIGLGFYFQTTDSEVWYYDINPANIEDGWGLYYANFSDSSSWYGFSDNTWSTSLSSATFDDALTSVDQLGIYIVYHENLDGQVYGIDDFGLTVPEPETYLALGVALLSVAFVFRRKITDSLEEARAMMQM